MKVTILGGGGLCESMLRLFAPFGVQLTVVRRSETPIDGADRVVSVDRLHEVLPETDVLIVALSLTPETTGIIGAEELALLPDDAILVNVARGKHVVTDALVDAVRAGTLGGVGLDVTEPEPLPDGHPLFDLPNVIVTPHCANTAAMGRPRLEARIADNVRRWSGGQDLIGYVNPKAGY